MDFNIDDEDNLKLKWFVRVIATLRRFDIVKHYTRIDGEMYQDAHGAMRIRMRTEIDEKKLRQEKEKARRY